MAAQSQLQPVWLVSDGRVLASAMRATTRPDRRRGLIGVRSITYPLVIDPCNWVHSIGMRSVIDVVYLDADSVVIAAETLKPWRVGPYTRLSRLVIEAPPGFIEKWNIAPGTKIEVRNVES